VEPPLTNVDNFVGSEGTTLDITYQDLIATADEADDGVRSFTAWRPDESLWQHATPFLRRLRAIGTYKRPTKAPLISITVSQSPGLGRRRRGSEGVSDL
jgi:hypothetical protein